MDTEYKNSHFGDIKLLSDAIDEYNEARASVDWWALHTAVLRKINAMRKTQELYKFQEEWEEENMRSKLKQFEDRLVACESNPRESVIQKPTATEINNTLKRD